MTEREHAFYDKEGNDVYYGDRVAVDFDGLYEEGAVTKVDGEPAICNGGYMASDYGDYMTLVTNKNYKLSMTLRCSMEAEDYLGVVEDFENVGVVFEVFNYYENGKEEESAIVNLSKDQIRELHKELGKYLENIEKENK